MEKIDPFFRDALENHEVTPSAHAWDKLEQKLDERKRGFWMWRAAAAILVGAAAVWLLLPAGADVVQPVLTENVIPSTPDKEVASRGAAPQPKSATEIRKKRKALKTVVKQTENTENPVQPLAEEQHLLVELDVTPTKTVANVQKPIVIEFTLEELPAQTTLADAQPEKEVGFKKVLTTIKEIKNGDRNLGLRDATHELFASNKRNEKTSNH